VPELRVDLSDLPVESIKLIGQLAMFLEENANVKAEISGNGVVVKSEEAIKLWQMRKILKEFLQKVNLKGKVKKGKRKTLRIVKDRGKPVFCGRKGRWKREIEKRLEKQDELVLYSSGNVKYDVLDYIHKNKAIEILKLETRYMKKREKGLGLKVTVRKHRQPKPLQNE
jgi:hypothetical protein